MSDFGSGTKGNLRVDKAFVGQQRKGGGRGKKGIKYERESSLGDLMKGLCARRAWAWAWAWAWGGGGCAWRVACGCIMKRPDQFVSRSHRPSGSSSWHLVGRGARGDPVSPESAKSRLNALAGFV
jgi:hypothetical protein